jgi:hypothetical protein
MVGRLEPFAHPGCNLFIPDKFDKFGVEKRRMRQFYPFLIVAFSHALTGQDTLSIGRHHVTTSAYIDTYFAEYTDSVGAANYQKFPTISPHNGFGLNTVLLSADYLYDYLRGTFSLQFGDIARSAWSSNYNSIVEAHAGLRLSKKVWMDAGFFRTHIGTEGIYPRENIAASLAVATFNEPFYQAGVRLQLQPDKNFQVNLFALNGYNLFEDNNQKKSFGSLTTYALRNNGTIGYSNYIGDDTPAPADSLEHLRAYHNLFVNYYFRRMRIQAGVDYATQHHSDALGKRVARMYSGLLAVKYSRAQYGVYLRAETFHDPQGFLGGVIINKTGRQSGYLLWGMTVGIEYRPHDRSYIRLEARELINDPSQPIYHFHRHDTNIREEIHLHFGITF